MKVVVKRKDNSCLFSACNDIRNFFAASAGADFNQL